MAVWHPVIAGRWPNLTRSAMMNELRVEGRSTPAPDKFVLVDDID